MGAEAKSNAGGDRGNKKGKQRFLQRNKPARKGSYPLRPGVQGFFITCDGGRERQASQEAVNVLDSFYEELTDLPSFGHAKKLGHILEKPMNKKIKFSSDSSSSDDEGDENDEGQEKEKEKEASTDGTDDPNHGNQTVQISTPDKQDGAATDDKLAKDVNDSTDDGQCQKSTAVEGEEPPPKRQCLDTDLLKAGNVTIDKEEKSIDKLIEEEIQELGDKSKRRFNGLDSGCNGVVFVQMKKFGGDPTPKELAEHMMTSISSTKKHISRFLLRVLPVEVTCYASEEEITKSIEPLIAKYFPAEAETAEKYAVLFEARANTGIDRMKIIDAVAKSVPAPHKVDLTNPNKTIVVQIAKTVCSIGIVEKYKELAKYNIRQLTSSTKP
ncbi:THUMP domain-containing protein 1 [Impatiens glandulifera]|uniref:THUMP domain-containing protein 1 n=1 Tax=Impatiens glandulifera TaxID=253017 RepID=UPI001FB1202B|nr:THUMP domain-containing protein 1 [Impatiens glandulifera]